MREDEYLEKGKTRSESKRSRGMYLGTIPSICEEAVSKEVKLRPIPERFQKGAGEGKRKERGECPRFTAGEMGS